MKFTTLPTTNATNQSKTGSPFVACFPSLGSYGPPPAVADYTPYPKQFSLARMAEMWWRWKVLVARFTSDFTGTQVVELLRLNNTRDEWGISDERQLIFPDALENSSTGAYWSGGLDDSSGGQTKEIFISVRIMAGGGTIPEVDPVNATPYYFEHSGDVATYTPAIEIKMSGFWDRGTEWSIAGTTAGSAYYDDEFVAVLDGDNYAMQITYVPENNCSLNISVADYFTWAKADGSEPTWSASTGARV